MAFNEDIQYQIQRYLEGEMSESERQVFEQIISKDKNLAQEIALQKEIEELLADTPENALRQNLQTISNQVNNVPKETNGPWRKLLWLLPILLVVAILVWNMSREEISSNSNNLEKESAASENGVVPETFGHPNDTENSIREDTLKTEPTISETTKEAVPNTPTKPQKDTSKQPVYAEKSENLPIEVPMIFAGPSLRNHDFFAPLLMLDSIIRQNLMDENSSLVITQKLPDTILKDSIYVFNATLKIAATELSNTLGLYLYPNHAFYWNGYHHWDFTTAAIQKMENNTYQIRMQPNTNLEPGLYYYALRSSKTGTVYFMDKFVIDGDF